MGEFEITCKNIMRWAEKIDSCCRDVKRQEGRMEDVLRRMWSKEKDHRNIDGAESIEAIVQALSATAENLHRQREQMKQYGDMLGYIVRAYDNTENSILEKASFRSALEHSGISQSGVKV